MPRKSKDAKAERQRRKGYPVGLTEAECNEIDRAAIRTGLERGTFMRSHALTAAQKINSEGGEP